jgi:hypothetical protein
VTHGFNSLAAVTPITKDYQSGLRSNIDGRATMIFENTCKAVNDPGSVERELWDDIRLGR